MRRRSRRTIVIDVKAGSRPGEFPALWPLSEVNRRAQLIVWMRIIAAHEAALLVFGRDTIIASAARPAPRFFA